MPEKKKSVVPRLRFSEFRDAGEWEVKQLGVVAEFFKGKNIAKSDISPEGKTFCIRYGELYTLYQEVIAIIESRTNLSHEELFLSLRNDVLIPSSGETKEDIAKASCVLLDGVALGGDINVIRSTQNGIFLSYYLNSSKRGEIAKIAQGDSVVHLYANQLKQLYISVPTLPEEQQKIADCLSSLDEVIDLQAQKLYALKAHKKGLMQQLFPREGETTPSLRFPEFRDAGEWEEIELGSIGNVSMCKRVMKHETSEKGDIPFYKIGTFGKKADAFINKELYESYKSKYPYPKKGDILISASGTIGRLVVYDGLPAYFQDSNIVWMDNDESVVINSFLFYCYGNINWKTDGNTISRLYNENIRKIKIHKPLRKEQKKIADCLASLDEVINLQTQKLDALKAHKKGLMQQLFPQEVD